jgi:hypothetical protein
VEIDLLFQVIIEEGGLDVHVMHTPTLLGHQCEETNGLHPRNRHEGVVEVDSLPLDEPARH